MDEARKVLERLERIDALDLQHAPPSELLVELRALIADGEAWLRAESHPQGAVEALAHCRAAMAGGAPKEEALLAP